jgi:hypothetical protein
MDRLLVATMTGHSLATGRAGARKPGSRASAAADS